MTEPTPAVAPSRRSFLRQGGAIAATSAFAGLSIPRVHAGEDNTIRLALVGCGGRGTGAAADAMSVPNGPVQLVAMADVFEDRLDDSYKSLDEEFSDRMDVPEDRRFLGFDAFEKAMDCLKPGDVVMLTTPPAFRWVQFTAAIARGLNVFMEKPSRWTGRRPGRCSISASSPWRRTSRLASASCAGTATPAGSSSTASKTARSVTSTSCAPIARPGLSGVAFTGKKPDDISELLWQIKRFHGFMWASGGCYSDFLIHNIDECCWMKDAWPVQAKASGGRLYRGDDVDQNFDHYSVEYTFADGSKFYLEGRNITGCDQEFASYAHGTKGSAVISTSGHTPARCRTFDGQNLDRAHQTWRYKGDEPNPYRLEWEHLIDAIRHDKSYNEVRRGAEASLVTSMGRMAAHTGQVVTYDEIFNCPHEFAPSVDALTYESPAPLASNEDGTYPVPLPGILRDREF